MACVQAARVARAAFSGSVAQLRFACLPLAASERSETEPPENRVLCTLRSFLDRWLNCASLVCHWRQVSAAKLSRPRIGCFAPSRTPTACMWCNMPFEPMGKPIGYNPARLQRAYLPMPGIELLRKSAMGFRLVFGNKCLPFTLA